MRVNFYMCSYNLEDISSRLPRLVSNTRVVHKLGKQCWAVVFVSTKGEGESLPVRAKTQPANGNSFYFYLYFLSVSIIIKKGPLFFVKMWCNPCVILSNRTRLKWDSQLTISSRKLSPITFIQKNSCVFFVTFESSWWGQITHYIFLVLAKHTWFESKIESYT